MASRLWLLGFLAVGTHAFTCDRIPEGRRYTEKTPTDGRFVLEIADDEDTYAPNTAYTLVLRGQVNPGPNRFTGFFIVAESDSEKAAVGTFQTTEFLTKFSERCPNAIMNSNNQLKSEIQAVWTSPPPNMGCITIRATVIEPEVWHMDDASLTKTLCEREMDSDLNLTIVEHCCACNEAKYEVTFEGIWSRHTHPKDFPSNKWMTRFSDVIGASHAADYRFWKYGHQASEGLRQLAEHGDTKELERELKAESDHIRTIIKARGISFPNLTGKTFAVFRVDNRHHLMSLVSMLDPSPDWIVGVSGLELCLKNCTWVESKVINLYPWDAGTDSGTTYLSPDEPSDPRDVIRKIGPTYPNDSRSPFYDTSGKEMKPLAKLYLSRQRLYEKNCDGVAEDPSKTVQPCDVTPWAAWEPCSVTCGTGFQYRNRKFRTEGDVNNPDCNIDLSEKRKCSGPRKHCRVPSEYEPDPAQTTGPCALTEWSSWTGCSQKCEWGYKARVRKFKYRGSFKRCHLGLSNRPVLQQTIPCFETNSDCPEFEPPSEDEQEEINPNCPVTPWSEWSHCSVECGEGTRTRTRERITYPRMQYSRNNRAMRKPLKNLSVVGLHEQQEPRHHSNEQEEQNQDEEEDKDNDNDQSEDENEENCEGVSLMMEAPCEGTECDLSSDISRVICSLPKKVGPCRGYIERWFFDISTKTCEPFGYTGCRGNKNNFRTNKECWRNCRSYKEDLLRIEKILEEGNDEDNYLFEARNQTIYDITMQNDGEYDGQNIPSRSYKRCDPPKSGEITRTVTGDGSVSGYDNTPEDSCDDRNEITTHIQGPVINCQVSSWSPWGECGQPCGRSYKHRIRNIRRHPVNGGRKCPHLKESRECPFTPCEGDYSDNPRRDPTYPTWGPGDTLPDSKTDCEMGEWTSWSPCTMTCGANAIQHRTRSIVVRPSKNGEPCEERYEARTCNYLPCPQY